MAKARDVSQRAAVSRVGTRPALARASKFASGPREPSRGTHRDFL